MGTSESVAGEAALVFRYVISSTEMRHIERAERRVYVGAGPDGRLRLWGEIPGCGAACHADLAVLLLEYAMSCEGLPEPRLLMEASRSFVDQASSAMAAAIAERQPDAGSEERARMAMEALLWSMEAAVSSPPSVRSGTYEFAQCPLCAAAAAGGMARVADPAHRLLESLCHVTARAAAPGWTISATDDLRRPGHSLHLSLRQEDL